MSEVTEKKKYIKVGNGVEKFDGNLVEVSFCLSDIPQEHRFQYEGKWYVKLKVNKNIDGPSEYGKTHYVTINEWKPDPQAKKEPVTQAVQPDTAQGTDLPF